MHDPTAEPGARPRSPRLDPSLWLAALWAQPLLALLLLLVGGAAAFAYSYAPLHSARDWKIEYLEDRLATRNQRVRELDEALTDARASLAGLPTVEELAALEAQLDEATALAESREQEIAALTRRLDRSARALRAAKKPKPAPPAPAPVPTEVPIAANGPPAATDAAGVTRDGAHPAPASPAPAATGTEALVEGAAGTTAGAAAGAGIEAAPPSTPADERAGSGTDTER